jgi:hypothetical protein
MSHDLNITEFAVFVAASPSNCFGLFWVDHKYSTLSPSNCFGLFWVEPKYSTLSPSKSFGRDRISSWNIHQE